MKKHRRKETAAQITCEKSFEKKVLFRIERRMGDQIQIYCPLQRVHSSERESTDVLMRYSGSLDEDFKEGNHILLCSTVPCTARSAKDSKVTIDKNAVASTMSLNQIAKMLWVPKNTEFTARLNNNASQSDLRAQGNLDENNSFSQN